ncbi:MAG: FAD-dependent oxidoreductase [Candidatus Levybacteria bacterium]|nr:FAD-dependent oxidoreductase [Candidatus Levybacteria bacterium]
MNKAQKFELEFIKKEIVSKDAYSFYFNRKKHRFNFSPGQYLKLFLDIENPDERGSSRYFTISSSPTDKDFLTITTRVIKSSFKLKLNSLNPGDRVRAFGPIGYFDFDIKDNREQVFLAGGIGMTPAHSILRLVDAKKEKTKILLIVSFPKFSEIIFYEDLKEIESRNKNIKIIYTLTNEDKKIEGFEKGHINESLIKKYSKDLKNTKYFIVGSESFEYSMINLLTKMKIKEENMFKENFPGY